MLLTQQEVQKKFKLGRSLLLQWEREGVLSRIVKLPSGHRRYVEREILEVLGLSDLVEEA